MIFGPVEYIPPIEVAVKARRSGELFLISVDGIFFLSWDGLRRDIGMVLRRGSLLVCKLWWSDHLLSMILTAFSKV